LDFFCDDPDLTACINFYDGFWGKYPLAVEPWYFSITYFSPGGQENEWDTRDKALFKWYPGLPDLDYRQEVVRKVHKGFNEKVLEIGVRGFRVDAVKHVPNDYIASPFQEIVSSGKFKDEIYMYGEMATSDLNITNAYRTYYAMTDFFLLSHVGVGINGDLNLLKPDFYRKSEDAWTLEEKGASHVFPAPEGQEESTSSMDDSSGALMRSNFRMKPAVNFSRLHDSVVDDFYKIYNYQHAVFGLAPNLVDHLYNPKGESRVLQGPRIASSRAFSCA
jgi:glycosidase